MYASVASRERPQRSRIFARADQSSGSVPDRANASLTARSGVGRWPAASCASTHSLVTELASGVTVYWPPLACAATLGPAGLTLTPVLAATLQADRGARAARI